MFRRELELVNKAKIEYLRKFLFYNHRSITKDFPEKVDIFVLTNIVKFLLKKILLECYKQSNFTSMFNEMTLSTLILSKCNITSFKLTNLYNYNFTHLTFFC